MPNITTVNLTAGVPTGPAGAATVSTIDALMADGGQATVGAIADAAVTAGATGSLSAKLRSISRDLISRAASLWVAGSGAGLTWADIFSTATLNSIASGNAVLSDLAITNGTALDKYMDVSIALASAAFTGTGINISLHLYPLNADGSTYGDGKFGTSAAGPCAYPPVAVIPLVAATQAQTGSATGIVIPPGTFKIVLGNNGGVALAASANTCKYRTYN
jgi:hypothetical protein